MDMSAEAVVLRHHVRFEDSVLKAARTRLEAKDKKAGN